MTHAFFKALMFLGSGSVIHACHHEQDIFNYGGLRKKDAYHRADLFDWCFGHIRGELFCPDISVKMPSSWVPTIQT